MSLIVRFQNNMKYLPTTICALDHEIHKWLGSDRFKKYIWKKGTWRSNKQTTVWSGAMDQNLLAMRQLLKLLERKDTWTSLEWLTVALNFTNKTEFYNVRTDLPQFALLVEFNLNHEKRWCSLSDPRYQYVPRRTLYLQITNENHDLAWNILYEEEYDVREWLADDKASREHSVNASGHAFRVSGVGTVH